jgi:hypothetical protein
VRLRYAEVDHRCVPDLAEALTGHPEPVDVIATYTPFQQLRKMGRVWGEQPGQWQARRGGSDLSIASRPGAVAGTVIGTYPRGPILARNPALAGPPPRTGPGA